MNKTILVIEDDDFAVKAYKLKFEKEGFSVRVALDGNEAIAFFEKDPVDLVILDLMLPGINGFDVLAAMRKNKRWGKTPVIVMSNLGQEQDIKKCQDLGISDYFIKSDIKISEVVLKAKSLLTN